MRKHAFILWVLVIAAGAAAGNSSSFFAKAKARHAVVPLYASGHLEAAALVRVDAIFTEHERSNCPKAKHSSRLF